jgi:Bax inhibitor 1
MQICGTNICARRGLINLSTLTLQVYFGLLIFLGYMVYDTQEVIERAHHGDMDYIKHALTLFTDFVAVLVRILVIMVRAIYY